MVLDREVDTKHGTVRTACLGHDSFVTVSFDEPMSDDLLSRAVLDEVLANGQAIVLSHEKNTLEYMPLRGKTEEEDDIARRARAGLR